VLSNGRQAQTNKEKGGKIRMKKFFAFAVLCVLPVLLFALTSIHSPIPAQANLETAYFYLFSTIAQTVAGVLGFMGAFMLFRFNRVSDLLDQLVLEARGQPHSSIPDKDKASLTDWMDAGKNLKAAAYICDHPGLFANELLPRLRKTFHLLRTLRKHLFLFVALGVSTIAYSLWMLPMVPTMDFNFFFLNGAVGIFLTMLTLFQMASFWTWF
jgi:hypothetical protein